MRMAMVVLLMVVAAPVLGAGEVVQGTVVNQGTLLPGTTVRLASGADTWTAVTDENGQYSFRYVPAGAYELTVELPGFVTRTRRVDVQQDTIVPAVELPIAPIIQVVTISCSFRQCSDTGPVSRWDQPACADYELHSALIESAGRGDRSALTLLRRRYDTADTYVEQHRIGEALLGKIADDRAIWNALAEEAAISVRFPRVDDEFSADFETWCRDRNVEPENLWWTSADAFRVIATDRRARAMLFEVLKTGDPHMTGLAIAALTEHGDRSALPAIEAALARLGDKAPEGAVNLIRQLRDSDQ